MKISLIGPPGAGKGTIAIELSKRYKIPIIAIGRELRILTKTKLGKMLKEKYWGKGDLIPSKYALDILKKKITKKGYILDGFPRELKEAKMFEKIDSLDIVINLKVSQKTILERLSGRLQCKKCGKIYHKKRRPPKKKNICNKCNSKLYERDDDKKRKIIRERIKVYNKEIDPILKHFKKKKLLIEINGEGEVKDILKRIEKIL